MGDRVENRCCERVADDFGRPNELSARVFSPYLRIDVAADSTARPVGAAGKCRREKSWSYSERFTPWRLAKIYVKRLFAYDYKSPKVAHGLQTWVPKVEVSVR